MTNNQKDAVEDIASYILWLPSWYPNKFEPYNGDFVQRHAKAASLFCSIVVCHFPQAGHKIKIEKSYTETKQSRNLKELVHYISFRPTGINLLDKILYNISYYRASIKYLKTYFKDFGFPKVVHVHVPMKAGNLAIWIKRKFGISYILSEHASFYANSTPDSHFSKNFIHVKQVKNIFKNAKLVTNVSNAIGNVLVKLFDLNRVQIIHNVVDTSVFNLIKSKPEMFTFIHVSTLIEQKNIEGILRVFSKLLVAKNNWRLKLVGPLNDIVQQKILEYNLSANIELTGEVPYEEVARQMQKAHVLIMFSRHENFPCVIIEALCCGLPVISSDVGGIKEALNESNGILVSSENEEELLNGIIYMMGKFNFYDLSKISEEACIKYNCKTIGGEICNLYNKYLQ
jgi:glycosyltransferase involved in cell wall biosynthesis